MANTKALAIIERSTDLDRKKREVERFVQIVLRAINPIPMERKDYKVPFRGGYWLLQARFTDETRIKKEFVASCFVLEWVDVFFRTVQQEKRAFHFVDEKFDWSGSRYVDSVHENLD